MSDQKKNLSKMREALESMTEKEARDAQSIYRLADGLFQTYGKVKTLLAMCSDATNVFNVVLMHPNAQNVIAKMPDSEDIIEMGKILAEIEVKALVLRKQIDVLFAFNEEAMNKMDEKYGAEEAVEDGMTAEEFAAEEEHARARVLERQVTEESDPFLSIDSQDLDNEEIPAPSKPTALDQIVRRSEIGTPIVPRVRRKKDPDSNLH
jgi:hypothetical protein